MFAGASSGRGLGRVNSLKRDWDEPAEEPAARAPPSSQEIEWSPSPEV